MITCNRSALARAVTPQRQSATYLVRVPPASTRLEQAIEDTDRDERVGRHGACEPPEVSRFGRRWGTYTISARHVSWQSH